MNTMEIEKIFSMAIEQENEAHEFYKDVAVKVGNESVKEIFEELAEEEMKHSEILLKLKMDPTQMMKFKEPEKDYKVSEATDAPKLSTNMKPADAIALAMKKEQEAVEFYRSMKETTDDAHIKDIFNNLVNMELGHKNKLENAFVDIGYPEAF